MSKFFGEPFKDVGFELEVLRRGILDSRVPGEEEGDVGVDWDFLWSVFKFK